MARLEVWSVWVVAVTHLVGRLIGSHGTQGSCVPEALDELTYGTLSAPEVMSAGVHRR